MRVTRSGPCGAPATLLAETQGDRAPGGDRALDLQLGFRGFAAGFHPSLDAFLDRHRAHLGGLTRIGDIDTFIACIADMRPDYLILGATDAPGDLLDRIGAASRSPHLAVLLAGCDAVHEAGTPVGLMLEPVAADADGTELALALRALMRRSRPQAMVGRSTWGALELDEACLTFSIRGAPVSLSLEVFSVLGLMMDAPGRVWHRSDLHRLVFGATSRNDIRAIDTRISRARRHVTAALGRDPIRTVRGVGYALVPDP
jgi:hypothetical protein